MDGKLKEGVNYFDLTNENNHYGNMLYHYIHNLWIN